MELSYEDINIKPFAYAFSLIEGKWKMHILLVMENRSHAL